MANVLAMTPFKRLLVALDLSEADEHLIRYTEFLSKIYRLEDIYFLHIAKDLLSELDFVVQLGDAPAVTRPVDEELVINIQYKIKRYFNNTSTTNLHIEVLEGKVEQQLEHWVSVKQIDLALLGRQPGNLDSTVLLKRLVRHLSCSVWIVPQDTEPIIQRIVLPVDFSKESAAAIIRAQRIAERLDDVEIGIVHIYDVPPGHFQLSRTAGQFEKIMEQNSRDALETFLKKCNVLNLLKDAELLPEEGANPSREIYKSLKENPADLVIMGSRGHNAVERFLMGSVTEGLVDRHDRQAILVVKVNS